MRIDDQYNIYTYRNDYGVPVMFEAGTAQGFSIGDQIVFAFKSGDIENKVFTVNMDDFTFGVTLSEAEAKAAYPVNSRGEVEIPYSAKRYSNGQFLETLYNAKLIIGGTVVWRN